MASETPPALLTMPDFCGTLAAARCLGKLGVEVWTAGSTYGAMAAWSRAVARRLRSPPLAEPAVLLTWLVAQGRRHPGAVLYPTCDDIAWLQALHADELAPYFLTYAPACEVLERILDKRTLLAACASADLPTPWSAYPESTADLEHIARDAPMPVLIKQRTQILSSYSKGSLVKARGELPAAYADFVHHHGHAHALVERLPGAALPMLQAFHPEALSESYLISGFIDREGELFAARASNKILQRPRTLGIALCLEAAPLDPLLASKVHTLCRTLGYFGVFQVEFLTTAAGRLLIDFNPRYYHYMAFDIARGLPLPQLVHLAAQGKRVELGEAVRAAASEPAGHPSAFTYAMQLHEMLGTQSLLGTMSFEEATRWRRWYSEHRATLVDAVHDAEDPRPSMVAGLTQVANRVRHPRSFIRRIGLDQT